MRDHLIELFAYDRWANSLWLDYLSGRTSTPEENYQISHIFGSQQMWITRVGGVSPTEVTLPEATLETLDSLHDLWTAKLTERDLNEVISYTRTTGEPLSQTLKQIASHVINHGTYHRGVLRGIALNEDRLDFPDTDLANFYTRAQ